MRCVVMIQMIWLTMLISLVAMGMVQNESCSRINRLQSSSKLSPVHVPRLVHMALPEACISRSCNVSILTT